MFTFHLVDTLLLVLYVAIIGSSVVFFSSNLPPIHRKYLLLGFALKTLGALFFLALYVFYYRVGDTFHYFRGASEIWSQMMAQPLAGFEMLNMSAGQHLTAFEEFTYQYRYFSRSPEWFFTRVVAVVNLLCFNNFFCLSFVFALFAFFGLWGIYSVFTELYPRNEKWFFIVIFLPPSCLIWTSGILKDSICLGLIGLAFWSAYQLTLKHKPILRVVVIACCIAVIAAIKSYLAYSFLAALLFWLCLTVMGASRDRLLKQVMGLAMAFLALFFLMNFSSVLKKTGEQAAYRESMERVQGYHTEYGESKNESESKYKLNVTDYTPLGILKMVPISLVTATVRPYLWEAKKLMLIPMSLENLAFLAGLIWLISRTSFLKAPGPVFTNSEVLFCAFFILVLGVIVGLTSSNFGLLMRLKTPFVPFLGAMLVVMKSLLIKPSASATIDHKAL